MLLERLCDPMPQGGHRVGRGQWVCPQHRALVSPTLRAVSEDPGDQDAPRWERDYTRQAVPRGRVLQRLAGRGWWAARMESDPWRPCRMLTCIRSPVPPLSSSILRVSESKLWLGKRLSTGSSIDLLVQGRMSRIQIYTHTHAHVHKKLTGARMHAWPSSPH